MHFSFQSLPGERSTYFSEDGLAIVLFPLEAGQPAKLLRHADGLLRAYVFAPEDVEVARKILRDHGMFQVVGFKLLLRAADQSVTAFTIPAHAVGSGVACVLSGNETKTLQRLPNPPANADAGDAR